MKVPILEFVFLFIRCRQLWTNNVECELIGIIKCVVTISPCRTEWDTRGVGGGGGETALKDTCLQKKDNLLNDQGTGCNNFKKFNQII